MLKFGKSCKETLRDAKVIEYKTN